MEDGPVVAVVPPSYGPVVCREAINNSDFGRAWWLRDGRSRRPRSCSGIGCGAAVDDCCAFQVGAANASSIVEHTHVPSLAVSAIATALRASGHAVVSATSVALGTSTAWTACLAWLEAVAVGTASGAARATTAEG